MIIVGCSNVTDGSATSNDTDASAYRTSVQRSVSSSRASAAARESERQQTVTAEAVKSSCDALATTSGDAIQAVNVYVDAYNANSADQAGAVGPAQDALNRSAVLVKASLSDPLSTGLTDALNAWVDAAQQLADVLATDASSDELNVAIDRLNATKDAALDACDAAK